MEARNLNIELYVGHRERLRDRFLKSREGSFSDEELLELILCMAKPRGDVKPLSKSLIRSLEGFAGVINASPEALSTFPGVGKSVIANLRVIKEAIGKTLKDEITGKSIISSWNALLDYLRSTMGHQKSERLRVLYLNSKNVIIADELQETGTVNETPIYPREVVKRALFHGATAIILVHNHPSGDVSPSKADLAITRRVNQACELFDIRIHDHVIISKTDFYSFKNNLLL